MMHRNFLACALSAVAIAGPAQAINEFDGALRSLATGELAGWMTEPSVVAAILAQNAAHEGLSQQEIEALDGAWRAEVGAAATPMIDGVLGRPESAWLRSQEEATGGLVTEVFVMDSRGLNVAQSDITSDFWQGDEAKWQETYLLGAGAIHISEVELDESTQTYQSQVSMAVTDPASGAVIGAVTFGIDVSLLP